MQSAEDIDFDDWAGSARSFYESAFTQRLNPAPDLGPGLQQKAGLAAQQAYMREAGQTFDPQAWDRLARHHDPFSHRAHAATRRAQVVPAAQAAEPTILRRE